MKLKRTFLFGYGSHGRFIAQGLKEDNFRLTVIESNKTNQDSAKADGYIDTLLMDVTSDTQLAQLLVNPNDQIICVMEDEHLNVFLTLSLRALYSNSIIYAISDSIDTTQKLKMAGANRIIDLYEVSAKRISNIIKKPIATKLLDGFLSHTSNISFKEITIPKESTLKDRVADEINYKAYGILLVGVVDSKSGVFVFVTHGILHRLQIGDILVCIGNDADLEQFEEKIIGKEKII